MATIHYVCAGKPADSSSPLQTGNIWRGREIIGLSQYNPPVSHGGRFHIWYSICTAVAVVVGLFINWLGEQFNNQILANSGSGLGMVGAVGVCIGMGLERDGYFRPSLSEIKKKNNDFTFKEWEIFDELVDTFSRRRGDTVFLHCPSRGTGILLNNTSRSGYAIIDETENKVYNFHYLYKFCVKAIRLLRERASTPSETKWEISDAPSYRWENSRLQKARFRVDYSIEEKKMN